MPFYAISNPGVAALDTLITFGVSSSRGNKSKIGQFGSGFKFGVLALLREGLDFAVCLNHQTIRFSTEMKYLDKVTYNQVYYTINNGPKQNWPVALEFGAINWTNVDMALREFISNAIDNTDSGTFSITQVDNIKTVAGHTVMYVEKCASVQKYMQEVKNNFLHMTNQDKVSLIPNTNGGYARFYRRGVFVREIAEKSIFHYNGELQIDECRNSDPYYCESLMSTILQTGIRNCNKDVVEPLFDCFDNAVKTIETKDSSGKYDTISVSEGKILAKWFRLTYPNCLITYKDHRADTLALMANRGFSPLKMNQTWFNYFKYCLPTVNEIEELGDDDIIFLEPSKEVRDVFCRVNSAFRDLGFAKKVDPTIKMFRSQTDTTTLGVCKGNIVAMNADQISIATAIEELIHYHHSVPDSTRAFQEVSMKMVATLMELAY